MTISSRRSSASSSATSGGGGQYKARVKALPENYRTAVEALERYFMYFGGISKGDIMMTMLEDLADLFEQAAADGTPVRDVVGEDPVEFAETFLRNYADGQWINKERERLINAIARAEGDETGEPAHDGSSRPPGQRSRVQGLEKSYKELARAARRGLRRGAGQHLRPARLQRGRQDHGREDPVHAAQGRRGDGQRQRLRRRDAGRRRAGVDQPHRTVRGRRRDPHRAGEPRAGRPAAAPQGPGRDRRRPARALLADRRRRAEGGDLLRRHAPPARHRDEPDRGPAGDLPRRADDRARPAGAHRGVAGRQGARRAAARRCC